MKAKVFRFDPSTDASPYYREYQVEIDPSDHMTVMALLERIADRIDGTLSFFSHSACQHGICGRCIVRVDGKPCLACQTVLNGKDIVIDPIRPDVVKDLVVRN